MMLHIILTAFTMGLLSSFHCIGMCGAIAISVPVHHLSPAKKITGILLYNFGRTLTYAILGALFGLIGRQLSLAGFQQWFSIIAGLFILTISIQSVAGKRVFHIPGFNRVGVFVQQLISRFINKASFGNIFLLGMANGLLPCGLVYLAITGALAAGTITGAISFMVAFGLGTLPALFLLSYFGFLIRMPLRNAIKKMVPYGVGVMGVFLIVRGLGLGIYLSPAVRTSVQTIITCH